LCSWAGALDEEALMLRIVGIGGGTGLPLLLRGLARRAQSEPDLCLTGIVCVTDDGGSSGRLRRLFPLPALGDIRNCLLGLARPGSFWTEILPYRFTHGRGLSGHALGNLILTALCQRTGSLRKAVDVVAESMGLAGTVLPATEVSATLVASSRDGRRVRGECAISAARMIVERVWLDPPSPLPARGVLESLDAADAIVLGPGSLFTSVIPPLLVQGVADAIRRSPATRIYVCNLMGQPGETDGFTAVDHVRAVLDVLGPGAIDACLLNTRRPRGAMARRYLAMGAKVVAVDAAAVRALGPASVEADLFAQAGRKARHDADALSRLVVDLARKCRLSAGSRTRASNAEGRRPCAESSAT
jgi:uncharacterized cofD-like protein